MSRRLAERLSEAASGWLFGREHERDALLAAIQAPEPAFAVAYVHGVGGIGKSSLLRATVDALPSDYHKIRLDCREVEPTGQGVLAAIAAQTDDPGASSGVDSLAMRLERIATRTVIAFDTYETFGLLDSWLRQTLLPALPASVVTLIASREPPSPGWVTSQGWSDMFREIELHPLDQQQSIAMLCARGLSEDQARRINSFTRGHPLSLELAAAAGRAHPDLEIETAAIPRVVERLTEALLAGLDAPTVAVLEAASTVRRVTEPLLRALLEVPSARDSYDLLRRVSFVSALSGGLVLHDVMRDTIAYGLAQRDPARHATYRRRAWNHLNSEGQRSETSMLWQHTADLLYLVQNPNVRNAFFRPGAIEVSIEPAVLADRDAIKTICTSAEPTESTEWLLRWFDHHPETFFVGRTKHERVAGFYIIFQHDYVDTVLERSDPITAAWCAHIEANPVSPDERVLFCRRWLSREHGEAPGPIQAAFWVDIKRLYFELRPKLRRIYCPVIDLAAYAAIVAPLGFAPIDQARVKLGSVVYHGAFLDFGPASIDGWLSRLIGVELDANAGTRNPGVPTLRIVLFTDIVGHTEMMQRLGDARGREVLREHERTTRQMLHRYGGTEVKTLGDGFMASFESVSSALDCAVTLQRAFDSPLVVSGLPQQISIRIGLNAGEPVVDAGDLYGASVILASRIAAQASAGEILIPEPVRHLLAGKRFAFADRGEHTMKGFDHSIRLYQVGWHV